MPGLLGRTLGPVQPCPKPDHEKWRRVYGATFSQMVSPSQSSFLSGCLGNGRTPGDGLIGAGLEGAGFDGAGFLGAGFAGAGLGAG